MCSGAADQQQGGIAAPEDATVIGVDDQSAMDAVARTNSAPMPAAPLRVAPATGSDQGVPSTSDRQVPSDLLAISTATGSNQGVAELGDSDQRAQIEQPAAPQAIAEATGDDIPGIYGDFTSTGSGDALPPLTSQGVRSLNKENALA